MHRLNVKVYMNKEEEVQANFKGHIQSINKRKFVPLLSSINEYMKYLRRASKYIINYHAYKTKH